MSLVEDARKIFSIGREYEMNGEKRAALFAYYTGVSYIKAALQSSEMSQGEREQCLRNEGGYTQRLETLRTSLNTDLGAPVHIASDPITTQPNTVLHPSLDDSAREVQLTEAETLKYRAVVEATLMTERPKERFADVIGLKDQLKVLYQSIVLPITQPDVFTKVNPYNGLLLSGLPGVGKTFLAKAVAGEAEETFFFSVSASDLLSKYIGESEKLIKVLFDIAREKKPSVIFFDEVDSLGSKRESTSSDAGRKVLNELLRQMSEPVGRCNKGVFLIAATNFPENLDKAFLRRFDKRVYIPIPDLASRREMFKRALRDGIANDVSDEDLNSFAANTKQMSGGEIEVIIKTSQLKSVDFLQESNYFRKVCVNGQSKYRACQQSSPGAIPMSLREVPRRMVDFEPFVRKVDVLNIIDCARPILDELVITKSEMYAKNNLGYNNPDSNVDTLRPCDKYDIMATCVGWICN